MKNLCIRFVPALPSMDPCSPAQIHIFQIGKMGFIKTTDQTHHLSLIDGCSSASGENLVSGPIFLFGTPFSSGNSPAKCTVKITCIIQKISLRVHQHACTAGKSALVLLHRCYQTGSEQRPDFCIIVQQYDIRAFCPVDTFVDCPTEPVVLIQADQFTLWIVGRDKLLTSIHGTIIYNDHIHLNPCLCKYRVQTGFQKCNPVIIRNHNRYV